MALTNYAPNPGGIGTLLSAGRGGAINAALNQMAAARQARMESVVRDAQLRRAAQQQAITNAINQSLAYTQAQQQMALQERLAGARNELERQQLMQQASDAAAGRSLQSQGLDINRAQLAQSIADAQAARALQSRGLDIQQSGQNAENAYRSGMLGLEGQRIDLSRSGQAADIAANNRRLSLAEMESMEAARQNATRNAMAQREQGWREFLGNNQMDLSNREQVLREAIAASEQDSSQRQYDQRERFQNQELGFKNRALEQEGALKREEMGNQLEIAGIRKGGMSIVGQQIDALLNSRKNVLDPYSDAAKKRFSEIYDAAYPLADAADRKRLEDAAVTILGAKSPNEKDVQEWLKFYTTPNTPGFFDWLMSSDKPLSERRIWKSVPRPGAWDAGYYVDGYGNRID